MTETLLATVRRYVEANADATGIARTPVPGLTTIRVTSALVQALADTADDRSALVCRPELVLAALQVHHEDRLDGLHTRALVRSLASVCG